MSHHLLESVAHTTALARQAGFTMSCEPEVGALLAVLAAAVPEAGRILELGTGAGVGTAWLVYGLTTRTDVEIVTVDHDPATAELAARTPRPSYVRSIVGDAVHVTANEGKFDLIFADAQGGKWEGLDTTVAALRPGGHLLVDDMTPEHFADTHHERKTTEVRTHILGRPDLVSVPIAWSSGLILSTRRRT
jgi:predicted O-methyltransferase YrrM